MWRILNTKCQGDEHTESRRRVPVQARGKAKHGWDGHRDTTGEEVDPFTKRELYARGVRISKASQLKPGKTIFLENKAGPPFVVLEIIEDDDGEEGCIIVGDVNYHKHTIDLNTDPVVEVTLPF